MEIKFSSNIKRVRNAFGTFDTVLNRAMAESMRQVTQYALREGSRMIVATGAAPKLMVSQVWPLVKKEVHASEYVNFWDQTGTVIFSARSLKAKYFSPIDTVHRTRVGVRYGVTVLIAGKRIETGGIHLRGSGSNMKRIDGVGSAWGDKDWVFKRNEREQLVPFWFPSISDILRFDSGVERLHDRCVVKLNGYLIRNFGRYAQQVMKEYDLANIKI